jgi:hypothetical protein
VTLQAPPDYAVGVNDTVHDMPAQSSSSPLDLFSQIAASVRFAIDSFIGQVAIAFGGISIFGWKPFDFLAQWGQDRIAEASANYNAALGAQASANTANTGLAILNARVNGLIIGGAYLYDTFSRDVADIATDPAYDVEYQNGPGTMGLSSAASGTTTWNAVGYSDASIKVRDVTTPMTTNIVRLSTVIDNHIYGSAGNQSHTWLMGRMDAARQNYVIASIEINWAAIGYVVGGVYTQMGSQEAVTIAGGDLWDFEIGTLGDEWQFRLLQNNAPRVVRNDLGHNSHKDTTPGTTYKWTAFGGDCAIGAGPFFTSYQIGMPNFQVFAAADY